MITFNANGNIVLPTNYKQLTISQRKLVREEYIRIQEGKCSHCGNLLNDKPKPDMLKQKINKNLFPKNFFNYPIHLHHCHKTGMTIGAVHAVCNAILWQFYGE